MGAAAAIAVKEVPDQQQERRAPALASLTLSRAWSKAHIRTNSGAIGNRREASPSDIILDSLKTCNINVLRRFTSCEHVSISIVHQCYHLRSMRSTYFL
jgi:hypothetical protein